MDFYNGKGNQISFGDTSGVADNFFDITMAKHTNLCNPEAMTENVRMNNYGDWNNTVVSADACITDKIPCISGKYVYAGYALKNSLNAPKAVSYTSHMSVASVNFYTQEGKFVSCIAEVTTPVLVPDNAAFVIVSYPYQFLLYNKDKSRCFVTIKDTNADETFEFEPYTTEDVLDAKIKKANLSYTDLPPHYGKKWVLFGDSLTDNYGGKDYGSEYFASKIAREFGMVLDNRAKSGSNIYKGGSGNYVSVSGIVMLDAYLAEIEAGTTEQADYITVAFGTNTFKAQMGTNDDTSATNTSVYGATKYFIEKIREKVPNAVLGFVLSPRQNWGSNDPQGLRDLDGARDVIKSVCDEYGVPYIDMSKQSGITVDMLPDGIHISSEQSQKLYYHAMRRFMMGL